MKKLFVSFVMLCVIMGGFAACEPNGSAVITFNANGGEGSSYTQTIDSGSFKLEDSRFTRKGYSFDGWSLSATGDVAYADGFSITLDVKSVTLYAKWSPNSYALEFDANGGEGEDYAQNVVFDAQTPLDVNTFTRAGYEFIGWSLTATGAVAYADGASYTHTDDKNVTLYAQWEEEEPTAITYELTFDANGGNGTSFTHRLELNETIELDVNVFTREGYVFIGWSLTANGEVVYADGASYTQTAESNVVLFAQWEEDATETIVYKITFDANGGTGASYTQDVETDGTITLSANTFTREGYEFIGWSLTATGAVAYTDGASYTHTGDQGITLFAQWEEEEFTAITYELTFDANGGDGTSFTHRLELNETIELDVNVFTREGYVFIGWSLTANGEVVYTDGASYTQTAESNVVLFAQWEEDATETIVYKITFDANGGIGASYTQDVEADGTVTLSANTFTREGYEFIGWSLTATGAVAYTDGASYTHTGDQGITLFAQWKKIPETVYPANVAVLSYGAWYESAFVEWLAVANAVEYRVYYRIGDGAEKVLDEQLIRGQRADLVGLKGGTACKIWITAVDGDGVESRDRTQVTVTPQSYAREGFAFANNSPNKSASGAYNADGTLKDDAVVLYVTDSNFDNITSGVIVDSKGKVEDRTGLGNIMQAREKGIDKRPLAIRILGRVNKHTGVDSNALLNIKKTFNVTVEGIGEDALVYGWGLNIREANNVEVRNLAFNMFPDDSVSIQTGNRNIWVHNNDFMIGANGGGDKALGDGSCDVKADSSFITVSYNHFMGTGKSSLVGQGDSAEFFVTFHNNYFDASGSRHPRVRRGSVHVYNNYYKSVGTYGVGAAEGSSLFVEGNYFENTNRPMIIASQGSDLKTDGTSTLSKENGGTIRQINNYFDAKSLSTFKPGVDDALVAVKGGAVYNNFENNFAANGYVCTVETPQIAKEDTMANAGRMKKGNLTEDEKIALFVSAAADIGTVQYDSESLNRIKLAQMRYEAVGSKDSVPQASIDLVSAAVIAYNAAAAASIAERISALNLLDPDDDERLTISALIEECDGAGETVIALIENYDDLVAAYLQIQNDMALEVAEMIEALNDTAPFTDGDIEAILAAQKAYEELSPAQQQKVTNYSKLADILIAVEYSLAPLRVIDMIAAVELPITAQSAAALDEIKAAYAALDNTQKAMVTNYADFEQMLQDFASIPTTVEEIDFDTNFKKGNKKWASIYTGDLFKITSGSDLTACDAGTYTGGLKFDSTAKIEFTVTKESTLTLIFSSKKDSGGLKLQLNGTDNQTFNANANELVEVTITIQAGTYSIVRRAQENVLYYISVA